MENYMALRDKVMDMRQHLARVLVNNSSIKNLKLIKGLMKDLEEAQVSLSKFAEKLLENNIPLYTDKDVAKLGCKVTRVKDNVYSVAFYSMDNENDWHFICLCFKEGNRLAVYDECGDEDNNFWKVSPFVAELVNDCVVEYIKEREMFEKRGVMR